MTITRRRSARLGALVAALLLGGTLAACGGEQAAPPAVAAPTVAPLFGAAPPAVAAPTATARPTATLGVAPTRAALPDDEDVPLVETPVRPADAGVAEVPIYSGALARGWSTEGSSGMQIDLASTAFVNTSEQAIATTAAWPSGQLCLTLREGAPTYERDAVRGVSLWLSGGDMLLENDALAVQMQGSNRLPYWAAGDDSVKITGRVTDDTPVFSETRLFYLGINRTIPADTWVEVVVWLDDLLYEPDYRYVTGVCVKNDPAYRDTFYIDRVTLLVDDTQ